jgi:cytochrome b
MKTKILVWDVPSRLFHWGFAISLTLALGLGFLLDDDHPLFQLHMLCGIVALFLLVVRIGMGLVGSRYSRFANFPVKPRQVLEYISSAVFSKTKLYAGNNPGSAMAAVLMFLLVPALFISGIGFGGEVVRELHETLAWGLAVVIGLHLAGLGWHTFRHGENISLAMVTGRKTGEQADEIASAHWLWGAVTAIMVGWWIAALFANHNSQTATVTLPGTGVTLQLGEKKSQEGKGHRKHDD